MLTQNNQKTLKLKLFLTDIGSNFKLKMYNYSYQNFNYWYMKLEVNK